MVKEKNILKIKNLDVQFPIFGGVLNREIDHVHAVKNLSINIPRNKTIGIVGESGSGKSTFGKAILNVLKLTAPDVRVSGEVLLDYENDYIDILSQNRQKTLELSYRSNVYTSRQAEARKQMQSTLTYRGIKYQK